MMFDHDRSATRGTLSARALYVFNHANAFGSAPAHKLTERITAQLNRLEGEAPPRSFADYVVGADESDLPQGVTMTKLMS
jgi:CRISPR-associated protein Csd2